MKTFYTVRDIEDMFAAGVREIETHDDVVVTDVAAGRTAEAREPFVIEAP